MSELLRMRDVADVLGVSTRTVQRWVDEGRLPAPFVLSSRALRWRRSEVEAWLEGRRDVTRRHATSHLAATCGETASVPSSPLALPGQRPLQTTAPARKGAYRD